MGFSRASHSGRPDTEATEALAAHYAMHSHDPIAGCEAHEDAKRVMQRFHSLLRRYETVNNQDLDLARPTWMRWQQDAVELRTLNGKARAVSRQLVKGHLTPAGWSGITVPRPHSAIEDQELAQIALEIMDEAVPKGTAPTWGSLAAQVVDSYGSILKDTFN
ncbi:hypothetical protein NQ176_g6567 [Zarea fungicola]|uniref:Uncharacterized protein n=1 Tax=Zarea fungicola TaxID=93591 RepID=A0ACC1N3C5_9HYPO|nr:hypothetical protein NQ176_g6567 [Lecanicillium fungicola]